MRVCFDYEMCSQWRGVAVRMAVVDVVIDVDSCVVC